MCIRDRDTIWIGNVLIDSMTAVSYTHLSGVTAYGMYVQLENTIEGLVHVSNMEDDYYIFDENNHFLIGERKKKIYRIGDMVKIRVLSADIANRNIDFVLAE